MKTTAKAKASKAAKAFEDFNMRVRKEHADLVARIVALRPTWNADALLAVGKTYGLSGDPGLSDILNAVEAADALAAKFSV